jgi:tripartite ATP-independent transporter DctM subunit
MEDSELANRLVGVADVALGRRIKGAMGIVANISCALFGAVSGSTAATASCIGSIMIPRLIEKGYKPSYSASLLAAGSILGILIPPSIPMIIFGWTSGVSVAALFLGGIIPGLILTVGLSIFHVLHARRVEEKPSVIPEIKGFKQNIKYSGPALLMPVLILGTIYGGISTPTEAAALAVIYTFILGFFLYKTLTFKKLFETTVVSANKTSAIMFVLFSIQVLGRIYTSENLPEMLASLILGISDNKFIILLLINVLLLIIGMLMDISSAILIMTPLLLPVVSELGIDLLHFGVVMVTNLGVGYITPPVAGSLFITQPIAKTERADMLPTILLIFFSVCIPVILLVTYVPQVSTFLPRLLGY